VSRHPVWAMIQYTWTSWMPARSFFFILAFGWMIPPLIYLFVWSAAAGGGSLGGMTRDDLVSYYLVLIVVNQITYSQSNWTVGDLIRAGSMNALLLRPVPPVYHTLADEVAGKVVYLTLIVPLTALLGLILRPQVPWTWGSAAAFVPALALAWALRFAWGYALALLAFWATRADALLAVQDTLVFLLAGQVAPLALLPAAMQTAARALPFRYMLGFPVEVLNGQLAAGEIAQGFLVGGGWLAFSVGAAALLWRQGLRRYAAVGG
jgi:ABC-2 type transport system permease protein